MTFEQIAEIANSIESDTALLGDAIQPQDVQWVSEARNYCWYYAVSELLKPRQILELGVRYGYALLAMAYGSARATQILGIDAEADGIESNAVAEANIRRVHPCRNTEVLKMDTRDVNAVVAAIPSRFYNLIHIDGDHSPEGILNELSIAARVAAPDAVILVDDCEAAHIRGPVEVMAAKMGITPIELPTRHKTLLIDLGIRR